MPCNQKIPHHMRNTPGTNAPTTCPYSHSYAPCSKINKFTNPHFFQVHQPTQFPPSPIDDHCFGCRKTTITCTIYTLPMCPTHALLTLKSPLFRNQQDHQCPSLPGTPNSLNLHFHISVPITFVAGLAWNSPTYTSLTLSMLSSSQVHRTTHQNQRMQLHASCLKHRWRTQYNNPIFAAQNPPGTQSTNQGSSTCNYMESNELN